MSTSESDEGARYRRTVTVSGRRTSISIETVVWDGLEDISNREELTLAEILTLIDQRRLGSSLASAVRVFVLFYFRTIADIAQPLIRAANKPSAAHDSDDSHVPLTPPNTLPGLLDKVLERFATTRAELTTRGRQDH
ncbi:ribbon-helix-helix domain-containing protein [Lacibacterium aquatile]|uniref:Ribbon-helix-helix domain-containing protein n=1 Tax=Lacibacterium aquatile TaxID=1168082 RepID=A0ABW5DUH8_9PROT